MKKPRRFGIPAALMAVLALVLALPAGASALKLGTVEEFSGASKPLNITSCGENLWFTEQVTGQVGRVTPGGEVKLFSTLSAPGFGIACGSDGNVWVALSSASKVAKVIPSEPEKAATEYSVGTLQPRFIVTGPDKNLWFTAPTQEKIGKMTTEGTVTGEYVVPAPANLCSIAAGGDGNVWFGDCGAPKRVGKITTGGSITPYEFTGGDSTAQPNTMALGGDGNIWFATDISSRGYGKVTPSGEITTYETSEIGAAGFLRSLTTGPEGNVWAFNTEAANEVQEVTIQADESLGGSYKLCGENPITKGGVKCTKALAFSEGTSAVQTALRNEVFGAASGVTVAGSGTNPVIRKVTFGGELARLDVPLMTCKAEELTGTNPKCSVATITESRPHKFIRINMNGKFTQFAAPSTTQATGAVFPGAMATGSDGNLWFTENPIGKIGKLGVESKLLTVSKKGNGTGTVTSSPLAFTGSPQGINCGSTCFADYEAGTEVTLTQEAGPASKFTGWGGACSGTGVCKVTMSEAKEVTATFTTQTLSVSKTGAGLGTVTSSPEGINCGSECSANYSEGVEVTLSQEAEVGSKFTGWGGACSGTGTCVVTMSESKSVTANFISVYSLFVSTTGIGTGTVTSTPAGINCSSECSAEYDEGTEVTLKRKADEGSKFTGWSGACTGTGACVVTMDESKEVTAEFGEPTGPTNRRTITLTKTPAGNAGLGLGTVSSKPKGIKCAQACDEAIGRFFKEQAVVLTALPSGELSAFDKWVGCPSPAGLVCTIPAGTEDVSVEAVFKGSSKAFTPAEALTLSKGESEANFGWGTVKAAGLTCEAECEETTVLYQGPITLPKPKAGKTVELKALPAFGSEFVGWSGACSGTELVCKVTMEEAKSVTAEFADLPDYALTVQKAYSGGLGTVTSKPKGINCGTTCTNTQASMPEGALVELIAKPAKTEPASTFVKWEGGDCEGKTEAICKVTMDQAETLKAIFSGPVKTIVEPKSLVLTKEGSGYGTVKAAGLACEVLCTTATSLYYGPVTLPKAKAGAKVTLKATTAPGSTAVTWTGCETNPTPNECVVVMNANTAISAKFDELE